MIVIDVEMPETCDFCPCVHKQDGGIYDEDYCQITHYAIEEWQHGRPEWCPLYEIRKNQIEVRKRPRMEKGTFERIQKGDKK